MDAAFDAGGGEVWVAAGTYTSTADPVLTMKADVALYGGFTGNETARDQRNWNVSITIIDGENSRRCVIGADNAVLDGFTITEGDSDNGGGMYNYDSSPTVTNCTLTKNTAMWGGAMCNREGSSPTVTSCTFAENMAANHGGGMYNYWDSSPTVTNCTLTGNRANWYGGGMYNYDSSPTVTNCTLTENTAMSDGGGMCNREGSSPTVINCSFSGNTTVWEGGGMCNREGSSPTVINCTFTENTAYAPYDGACGGMYNYDSSPTVTNCILWGNTPMGNQIKNYPDSTPIVTYSCVQGSYPGMGNIDSDPLFLDAPYSFQLKEGSACIDTGTTTGAPESDLLDRQRPQGNGIDMGAYEGAVTPEDQVTLTISAVGEGSTTPPSGTYLFGKGEIVFLRACGLGEGFSHWSDNLSGSNRFIHLLMDSDKNVTAHFQENIYYVDAANTAATPDGCSWAKAFTDLQSAVDAASADGGGEIWVSAGTFIGTDDPVLTMKEGVALYGGFAGTETARDQRDWSVNATIIDGENIRCCVTGANNAVLDGYTIMRGYTIDSGGGMYNSSSSPTVANCIFTENMTHIRGGGMHNRNSSPTVINCSFTENTAEWQGGGMSNFHYSSPTVTNCTFTENTAESRGGGMSNFLFSTPTVTNCILWGNTPMENQIYNEDSTSSPSLTYSCVQGGDMGMGNIDADPKFVDAPYCLQLKIGSPCIDAGTATGAPATDLLGRQRPQGDGIDIGAYEGAVAPENQVTLTISAVGAGSTTPPVGIHLFCKGDIVFLRAFGELGEGFSHWTGDVSGNNRFIHLLMDSDKNVIANFQENIYYVDVASTTVIPDGRSWTTAFADLQSAVDAASSDGGGEVWVTAGTYTGTTDPVLTMKEKVALYGGFAGNETSRDQRNWQTRTTIIDGANARRCITGANNAVLDGFTITKGYSADDSGGGMYNYDSSPTVTNCIFAENKAHKCGGGMYNYYRSSPTVTNCSFAKNKAHDGGGMYSCDSSSPMVTNCTFAENKAGDGGGGMYNYDSSQTVTNCTFTGNTAGNGGGGMQNVISGPAVTNCTFTGNTAGNDGGGMSNANAWPTVTNCSFVENKAEWHGGGMSSCQITSPTVTNCTFTGNTAISGSAMSSVDEKWSPLRVTNCILWGNMPKENQIYNEDPDNIPIVTYSCVEGDYPGMGNIDSEPLFVDAPNNLELSAGSPCIDTGTPTGAPDTDIVGLPRPQGFGYDMGAYEYIPGSTEGEGEVPAVPHPADINGDGILSKKEVDDFILGWQKGTNSMTFAIRALYLLKLGGSYSYDSTLPEPECWFHK